ncbi:MAG: hypothetical protein V1936_01860 [Patescibacteria group bacterium]
MRPKTKKRLAQAGLIALVVALVFLPSLDLNKVRAYLTKSITGTTSYNVEPVWGQAYSPNIGWVNFYCDGAGHTQPEDIRTNYPDRGAAAMSDFCDSIAYQTSYDPNTGKFSGEAYSSIYGWLDMNGVEMSLPAGNLLDLDLTGQSTGSTLGTPYNFGQTYFAKNEPNAFNPGLKYYNDKAYFCGFAYSEGAGYLSFCDPQTKERAPRNVSVFGYDWDSYAVYLGIPEEAGAALGAPVLTSAPKIFAATDAYNENLWFMDDASDIASVEVKIYDSNGVRQTYTASYFDPYHKRASVTIASHDFHAVGDYDLVYTACDNIGNCATNQTLTGFFQVVAAEPSFVDPANSFFEFGSPVKISDGIQAHSVRVNLVDRFGNPVISVEGVKEVSADFKFENTTKLDQIAGTGDSAIYRSSEFGLNQEGGTSTGFLNEANGGDGKFKVDVSSYAPTSNGYEPIRYDGRNLYFKEITYRINPLAGLTNVGEQQATVASNDSNRKFNFAPTLISSPQALIWDGNGYSVSSNPNDANITINAVKRFNIDLKNQSSGVEVSEPGIGVAIDSGNSLTWEDGVIEKADSSNDLSTGLEIDADSNNSFDRTVSLLGNWIKKIKPNFSKTMRFRAVPHLKNAIVPDAILVANLQTYVCYDFSGKHVCHRSESLFKRNAAIGVGEDEESSEGGSSSSGGSGSSSSGGSGSGSSGGAEENTPAPVPDEEESLSVYNPSIEILGSVRSASGTSSRQTGSAVNQSLGDVVREEFKAAINRNTVVFTKSLSGCSASGMKITGSLNGNFAGEKITGCNFNDNGVLYLEGDVTLEADSGTLSLPDKARTLLVYGGNVTIKSNLAYASKNGSLGLIILKKNGAGGNIYIYPNVTNLVGAVYAEGSIISVNSHGKFGEDPSPDCNGNAGFCDRGYELHNQLYWKGLLATANTIGGSDKTTPECPNAVSCGSRENARLYDLSYMRTFYQGSGGLHAEGTDSNASFVVELDPRIQNNTPPLFGSSSSVQGGQLGGNILDSLQWLWPF